MLINKKLMTILIIFGVLNLWVFYKPLTLTLLTLQPFLFFYYLNFYLCITVGPVLLFYSILKASWRAAVIFSCLVILQLIFVFSILPSNAFLVEKSKQSYPVEKMPKDAFLTSYDQGFFRDHEFKDISGFCFSIFLPSHLSDQNMKVSTALASTGRCDRQILIVHYTEGLHIAEVPSTYDYTFRKGLENLQELKSRVLSGSQIQIRGKNAYILPIGIAESVDFDNNPIIPSSSPGYLLYWQENGTDIFLSFSTNIHDQAEGMRIVESMTLLNDNSPTALGKVSSTLPSIPLTPTSPPCTGYEQTGTITIDNNDIYNVTFDVQTNGISIALPKTEISRGNLTVSGNPKLNDRVNVKVACEKITLSKLQ